MDLSPADQLWVAVLLDSEYYSILNDEAAISELLRTDFPQYIIDAYLEERRKVTLVEPQQTNLSGSTLN